MRFMPNKTDRARLNQRFRMEEKAAFVAHIKQKMHQRKRVVRSGYAFSQQEGWGPLITSGRMQSKATSRVRPSNITNVSRCSIFQLSLYHKVFLDNQPNLFGLF